MPLYYFHVHDGRERGEPIGVELPDPQAVRAEAIRAAGEMLREAEGALTGEKWMMDVFDEDGRPVLTLRFSATEHAQ